MSQALNQLLELTQEEVALLLARGEISPVDYHDYLVAARDLSVPEPEYALDDAFDEDDTGSDLEAKEQALAEIDRVYASVCIGLSKLQLKCSSIRARRILVEKGVREARRNRNRALGITLGDGTHIFSIEAS